MLRAVSTLQEQIGSTYQPAGVAFAEKKLWTCANGPESIADALLLQVIICSFWFTIPIVEHSCLYTY